MGEATMRNGSRRAILVALMLTAITGTQALGAQSNSVSDRVYCHNIPGFIDPVPPLILLTYTSSGKVRFGNSYDLGTVVDIMALARYLEDAADADPQPIVEVRSERPQAKVSAVLPIVRLAQNHKLAHVWIDTYSAANSVPITSGQVPHSKVIFCTLGKEPAGLEVVALTVSADGSVFWNGNLINVEDLQYRLAHAVKRGQHLSIHITVDSRTSMRNLTDLLLVLQMNRTEWFQLSTN